MRAISTVLQLMLFALFVVAYVAVLVPAAAIVALRKPVITPGRRVKTTIGLGQNIRRIY